MACVYAFIGSILFKNSIEEPTGTYIYIYIFCLFDYENLIKKSLENAHNIGYVL